MLPIEKDQIIEQELALVKGQIPSLDAYPSNVQRALRCLRENLFDESCNVNAILECCKSDKTDTRARFKYHLGMKIHDYLEDLRMRAAVRLLQYDELEIYVIALSIGYANYRTFERAFQRYAACSPTESRSKMSSENVQ